MCFDAGDQGSHQRGSADEDAEEVTLINKECL